MSDSTNPTTKVQGLESTNPLPPTEPPPPLTPNEEPKDQVFDDAPDGGLQAWLVVAGGACIFFACLGFANSFGVFQAYYGSHQLKDHSPDAIAWIGSLAAFVQFAGSAVGGPLFDRFGAWFIVRPAAVLYVLAIIALSFCTQYWHFMLAQGVLMGLTMSFLQLPALAAAAQYFDKRRAAALGLVVAGSSIGGVVIPIALTSMLNGPASSTLSFGWSVRIVGFAMAPFMAVACFTVRSRLPPRKTNFFVVEAFHDRKYILLIVALFFMFLGMFTPLFFLPIYAVSRGMDASMASYLLAIVNASSIFGRIIPGVIADRYGRLNIFSIAGLSTGIVIMCLNLARSTPGLVVYAIVFGFTSGMIISGASAAFSVCPKDPRETGMYMGMGMAVGSIAVLIGPPVNGILVDRYGGFFEVSMYSGIMCLVGGFAGLASKWVSSGSLLGWI